MYNVIILGYSIGLTDSLVTATEWYFASNTDNKYKKIVKMV